MSVQQLAIKSGEQNKTIRSIESGNVCSLHHAVWMKNILGLDVNKFTEGDSGKIEKSRKAEELI